MRCITDLYAPDLIHLEQDGEHTCFRAGHISNDELMSIFYMLAAVIYYYDLSILDPPQSSKALEFCCHVRLHDPNSEHIEVLRNIGSIVIDRCKEDAHSSLVDLLLDELI